MSEPKEKIKLNGIPVFRTREEDGQIKYVLFEDREDITHVLFISESASREQEYSIVLEQIKSLITPKSPDINELAINVQIQQYEQSKRDKQWLQKPTIEQTRTVVNAR